MRFRVTVDETGQHFPPDQRPTMFQKFAAFKKQRINTSLKDQIV